MVDFSKYKISDVSQEEKKISKVQKPIKHKETEKKLLPKMDREVNWDNLNINQDDLWFLYRLKFGKGTRIKRRELLPKFTYVFIKNLNELKK